MVAVRKRGSLDEHLRNNDHYKKLDVTEFLNIYYKEYAKYVIATRACPGFDGLKVGARKVMHAAFCGAMKNGNMIKMLNLIGDVYSYTLFMHGDAGMISSIFTKSAEFSDNLNPLEIDGQHGSLRAPSAQSAPRYLSIKLSKYAKILKEDYDLLEYTFDEGQSLEPTTYLPIIPLVLTSSQIGLAPGYKFQCSVGYNPIDVIDACTELLKTDKIKTVLHPFVRGMKKDSFKFDEKMKRWVNYGSYKIDQKHNTLIIDNLPYDVTYSEIEKILNNMKDNESIKDWKTFGHDEIIDYRIIFTPEQLKYETSPARIEKLEKTLRIYTVIQPNIFNVINEHGKLMYFENENCLIEYFVKWRLEKYSLRKEKMVKILEDKLDNNTNICKFIELVNTDKIKIRNRKKADIKKDLKAFDLPDTVLSVEISKLTDEDKAELLKKNIGIKKELEYINKTETKDMYLNDLKKLKSDLKNDFIEKKESLF
jgi:DNA topoisomerase-2